MPWLKVHTCIVYNHIGALMLSQMIDSATGYDKSKGSVIPNYYHSSMMATQVGEGTYVCTLDEETQRVAREELFEDPKQRASQIQALRHWVKSQPHITRCRTGIRH